MKKLSIKFLSIFSLLAFTFSSYQSKAHCEIPCGIYDDTVRIALIYEHISTIEKSINKINELQKSETPDYNQLVRWVMNKEEHAKKVQDIVSQYFLHQRIKPTDATDEEKHAKYIKELELLHRLLVYSMKAKQSTDLKHINKMRDILHSFEHSYFNIKGHMH